MRYLADQLVVAQSCLTEVSGIGECRKGSNKCNPAVNSMLWPNSSALDICLKERLGRIWHNLGYFRMFIPRIILCYDNNIASETLS